MTRTLQETPKKKPRTTKNRTTKITTHEMRPPTHDEIAERAREIHEKSEYQRGRDVEFWLEAERQLVEERKA